MPIPPNTNHVNSQLGEFLRERKAVILAAWERAVRELDASATLTQPALRDHMPDVIDHIAKLADTMAWGGDTYVKDKAPGAHARHRLDDGFDLRQMVSEYSVLRECVVAAWMQEATLDPQLALINRAIDQAMGASVERFIMQRDAALCELTENLREADAARQQTLQRLETVTQYAVEALLMNDEHGGFTYMNHAAECMFGWSADELRGKKLHDVLHSQHSDGTPFPARDCSLCDVLRTGDPVRDYESVFQRKNGTFVPASCSAAPVLRDGRVVGAVIVMRDLTARQIAAQQARARAEFEQQLVGIVSHDLRSPLGAIELTAATLLRFKELSPWQQRSLERIVSSCRRAGRLVRDLLDFTQARIGGGISIHRDKADVQALIRQAIDEVRLLHPQRIFQDSAQGDTIMLLDADRMIQVVGNLLANAVQYGAADAPIEVHFAAEAHGATLRVHNQGPPIGAQLLPHLFTPLRRGDTPGINSARSIGLGLFIVRHLVEAHAGTIQVTSDATAGTTFEIFLPRVNEQDGSRAL